MDINHRYDRSSEIMEAVIQDKQLKASLTIGKLIDALGQRAFGIVIIIFALMNILPFAMVPGFSVITSIPIFFSGVQMLLGLKTMWLPQKIMQVKLPYAKFMKVLQKSIPAFKKLEKFLKPRWLWLTSKWMERIIGLTFILLSLFLMLPIPFSNAIFGSIIAIIALGLIERDGLVLLFGWILAMGSMFSVLFTGLYLTQNLIKLIF